LGLAYATGLRASEAVSLKLTNIDSNRMVIRVEQGKGKKDWYVILSPNLLELLREWWRAARTKWPAWDARQADPRWQKMPDRTTPCERGSGVEALARAGASIWIDRGVCIADARRHLADAERDMRRADQERQPAQRTRDRQKQLSHITGASGSLGVELRAMRNAAASARKQAAAKLEAAGAINRASNSGSDVVNDILAAARRCRPPIRSPSLKIGDRARSPERFPGGSLITRNSPHRLPAGQRQFPDRRKNFPAADLGNSRCSYLIWLSHRWAIDPLRWAVGGIRCIGGPREFRGGGISRGRGRRGNR
jgi:hypothetical protein